MAAAKRKLLGEFVMGPSARDADGHLATWARSAKDAVALYLSEIERDPTATVVLTVSTQ